MATLWIKQITTTRNEDKSIAEYQRSRDESTAVYLFREMDKIEPHEPYITPRFSGPSFSAAPVPLKKKLPFLTALYLRSRNDVLK